jgi:hypothetical protein
MAFLARFYKQTEAIPVMIEWMTTIHIVDGCEILHHQWPFQEPKLEVPSINKAYIRPM